MHYSLKLMFMILCLNLACILANEVFVSYNIPVNYYQANYTNIINNWTPSSIFVIGDIISAFYYFVGATKWIFDGFPSLLDAFGVPSAMITVLRIIEGLTYSLTLIYFISGRE